MGSCKLDMKPCFACEAEGGDAVRVPRGVKEDGRKRKHGSEISEAADEWDMPVLMTIG